MQKVFILSWIPFLDESMSVWMNKFTRLECFFCPRKPHPKGNEYHTMCFGESGIIYIWDVLREGII